MVKPVRDFHISLDVNNDDAVEITVLLNHRVGSEPGDDLHGRELRSTVYFGVDDGRVKLRYSKNDDGQADDEPDRVCLYSAEGLSPQDLKRFPWATLIPAATARMRLEIHHTDETWKRSDETARKLAASYQRRKGATAARPPGRPKLDGSHYRTIASEYVELTATASRVPNPIAALTLRHNVSESTVKRWIAESRRRGLLAPGRRGKAG